MRRAEGVIVEGQVSRGAAALASEVAGPGESIEAARKQLSQGLGDLQREPLPPAPTPPARNAEEDKAWCGAVRTAALRIRSDAAPGPSGISPFF